MENLELSFPGNLAASLVVCPVFVCPVHPLCYWAIDISVHNIELAPTYKQLQDLIIFTPHAQRERGKVIGRGVHIYIYIYVCGRKKI